MERGGTKVKGQEIQKKKWKSINPLPGDQVEIDTSFAWRARRPTYDSMGFPEYDSD